MQSIYQKIIRKCGSRFRLGTFYFKEMFMNNYVGLTTTIFLELKEVRTEGSRSQISE